MQYTFEEYALEELPSSAPGAQLPSSVSPRATAGRALHLDPEGEPAVGAAFTTIEELRLALHAFKDIYNRTWIVERRGYQGPAAVRARQLAPLPAVA